VPLNPILTQQLTKNQFVFIITRNKALIKQLLQTLGLFVLFPSYNM